MDAETEARIRNGAQLSRTAIYALIFTAPVAAINALALGKKFDLVNTWSAFALAMAQVGGFYALTRSNETRSYLGEVRHLLHDLNIRWTLADAMATEHELATCSTFADLQRKATGTLRRLMKAGLFPSSIDAFSVWARDDKGRQWRIVAALGCSDETVAEFTQSVLTAESPGAGIVANLAVTADRGGSCYLPRVTTVPGQAPPPKLTWHKQDKNRTQQAETIAVFLLPDEEGVPVGAFALTSPEIDALEARTDGKLPERVEYIIDQCSASLAVVARKAYTFWKAGE